MSNWFTYTTPTITFTLTNINYTNVEYVRMAFKGETKVIREVDVADIDTEAGTFSVTLTQQETANLGPGSITMQGRIFYSDGTVQPTKQTVQSMQRIIDEEIIE